MAITGRTMGTGLVLAMLGLGCGVSPDQESSRVAYALPEKQTEVSPATESNPIQNLNSALEKLGTSHAPDAGLERDSGPPPTAAGQASRDPADMAAEVAELRAEVRRLQETVDLALAYLVGDLQEENRLLREEVARAYGMTAPGGAADPSRGVLVLEGRAVPGGTAHGAREDLVPSESAAVDYGEKGYVAVKEWGRTSEEAQGLGSAVASLRGMVCAVPPDLTDQDLAELGRRLRLENAGYDNVNIEVFDDERAARRYAEENVGSDAHRVLSVVKHKNSGRDAILVHRNGVSIEAPLFY